MNKHMQNYLDSFKFRKEHGYTFLIDMVFFGIISLIFVLFSKILEKKAAILGQGKTTEQIQQMLLSMDPELAQAFLSNLKGFVVTFMLGLIVLVAGGLLLYSLSRKLIWDYLSKRKFNKKTCWRWNVINLVLIVPMLVYLFSFGLIRLVLAYGVSLLKSQVILDVFYNLINLFFLFSLVIFVFLVYYYFAKDYKVWESIGKAFDLIKVKWRCIWPMFLLIIATAIVLSVVLLPIGKILRQSFLLPVNATVSLLFLAWMRIYVFRTIKE